MKRIMLLTLCAAMLLGLLSGCNAEDKPYVPTGDALLGEYEDPTKAPVVNDQELSLVYYPDRSLNPFVCTDFTNRTMFALIYQSLFTIDDSYKVEPLLCGSYSVSNDLKTYTFYVMEEATFSDGSPVTAEDVIASMDAAKESSNYKTRFYWVERYYLAEDGGIVFELKIPMENLLMLLDIPILKAEDVAAEIPRGSGPYYLNQTTAGFRLVRRNDWWCKVTLAVSASSIDLVKAGSPAQIRDEFEFNDVSLVCTDPGSATHADYRSDSELWSCETGIFLYVNAHMESKIFSMPQLRSVLTYAIDRDAIIEKYYKGYAQKATLPALPSSPFYNSALAEKYEYDPDRFKKEWDKIDWVTLMETEEIDEETGEVVIKPGEPPTIVILVNSEDTTRLRVARDIAKMFKSIGIEAKTLERSGYAYLMALWAYHEQYDLVVGQTKLSANMDLTHFFAEDGEMRACGLMDPVAVTLCKSALENSGNYYNLHKYVADDGRICPILFRSYAIYANRGHVTDLTPARDSVFYYSLGRTLESALITDFEPGA